MQRTTNYGLCQYEGSDKTSYLVNYNDDMLKIDTAIKGASDDASAAQTKANTADGKADVNAGNIASLNTQINGEGGMAADVVSLQGSVNTINSLIGNGEPTTTDKTLIGAINELNGNEGDLSSLITTEKSSLVGAINEVNANTAGMTNTFAIKEWNQDVELSITSTNTFGELAAAINNAATTLAAGLASDERLAIDAIDLIGSGLWPNVRRNLGHYQPNATIQGLFFELTDAGMTQMVTQSFHTNTSAFRYYWTRIAVADAAVTAGKREDTDLLSAANITGAKLVYTIYKKLK